MKNIVYMAFRVFIIFLLFVLINKASSQNPEKLFINETNISNISIGVSLPSELSQNWEQLTLYALLISFVFAVILYISSKALDSMSLRALALNEIHEFLASVVIFILIGSVIALLNNVFADPTVCQAAEGIRVNCFVQQVSAALKKLDTGVSSLYLNTMKQVADIKAASGFSETWGVDLITLFNFEVSTQGKASQMSLLPIKSETMNHARNIYIFTTSFNSFFNSFLIPLAIILLPIGLFLRSLFFTRRLGATIIALAFAAYVVFPVLLNYLMYLAGFIEPSSPYAPSPSCPAACSNPVPEIVDSSNNPVDTALLLKAALPSDGSDPFSNDTFMSYYNLSLGYISTYNGYKSCSNLSWSDELKNGSCPASCRVIPYPFDISVCRDYEYYCKKLYDLTNGGCFAKLVYDPSNQKTSSIISDPDFLSLRVPVLKRGTNTITIEQQHPVLAAVNNKCGYLIPSRIPPNVPLKDKDGNAIVQPKSSESNYNTTLFCPEIFRKIIIDISDLSNIKVIKPTNSIDINDANQKEIYVGCEEFYKQALPQGQNYLNFLIDTVALFNPGTTIYLNMNVTDAGGQPHSGTNITLPASSFGWVGDTGQLKVEHLDGESLPNCQPNNPNCGKVKINGTGSISWSSCDPPPHSGGTYGLYYSVYYNYSNNQYAYVDYGTATCNYTCDTKPNDNRRIYEQPAACNVTVNRTNVNFYFSTSSGGLINQELVNAVLRGSPLDTNYVYSIYRAYPYAQGSILGTYKVREKAGPSNNIGDISNEAARISNFYNLSIPVLVIGNCSNIAAVPDKALWLPPTIDCSKCQRLGFSPLAASLKSSSAEVNAIANGYIKSMVVPMIAIVLTAVIIPGLSSFLGGEMFIPGIEKLL